MSYQPPPPGWSSQPPNQPPYYPVQPPQGYPQQQYPNQPPPPKKKGKAWLWVLIAVVVLLGACGLCSAVFSSGGDQTKPAGTTQQATSEPKATEAPTATEAKPTEAPQPTAAPLTTEQRIMAIATKHKGNDSLYLPDQKAFSTHIKLGTQWSEGTMKDSVKRECYDLQKELWTANPSLDLESVIIFIEGDVIDQYGKESVEQVGACTLKKPTAEKFNWQNLTWRTAWEAYDFKSLAPFLQRA